MGESLHRSFRLLPSEQVLWHGRPCAGVARERFWVLGPALCFALAAVVALFAGLLYVAHVPAVRAAALLSSCLGALGLGLALSPRYLLDACEFAVTDRHVIWLRLGLRSVMDRRAITYARIHWHKSRPGVGHLELVRAVPFGPLSRKQRVLLHDIEAPDRVLALVRGVPAPPLAGDGEVPLCERLDPGERVLWGESPQGYRMGRAELATAVVGALLLLTAGLYAQRTLSLLVTLERLGLPVRSLTWGMLFLAIAISGAILAAAGALLLWSGTLGARADGSHSEYILTDRRVLIRRGRTELSIDRARIVDVAAQPATSGLSNLHLILDGPSGRALDDNGALRLLSPPRAAVLPVLYEVRDRELFRRLLFSPPKPSFEDAA